MRACAEQASKRVLSAGWTTALALSTVAAVTLVSPDGALAQSSDVPEITITKPPGGYGAYGRNLPGVYMTSGTGISTGPEPGSPQPAYSWVDPMPQLTYQTSPVGWVDGWHGAIGPGIPF